MSNNPTGPVSSVLLKISCTNLLKMDILSESDPMVIVSKLSTAGKEKRFLEVGRTEVMNNCADPDFKQHIKVEYHFEQYQKLRFDVYDADSGSHDVTNHDYIGYVECSLGSLIGERKGVLAEPLRGKTQSNVGNIRVVAEEIGNSKERLVFKPRGVGLDRKKWFSLNDPYLVISRSNKDGSFSEVQRTTTSHYTLNPVWSEMGIPMDILCSSDRDRLVRFECKDSSWFFSHQLIGVHESSVKQLLDQGPCPALSLSHPKKQKSAGRLELKDLQVVSDMSFLEYITHGLEMNFVVAVDFTGSNGDPRQPSSLHYMGNPTQPNQYQQAIWSVGSILQDYDADKWFPSYGFGACLGPNQPVSHMFNLNLQPNPMCYGVQGVLEAYSNAVRCVQLSGPTNFAPIITTVADLANTHHEQNSTHSGDKYFVLLMITDGEISDIETTKAAIVRASSLPLSIIIVGVGSASFEAMDELDSDHAALTSNGVKAVRDIVQFVPYRDFVALGDQATERLASAVLAEVPGQVTSYMRSNARNRR